MFKIEVAPRNRVYLSLFSQVRNRIKYKCTVVLSKLPKRNDGVSLSQLSWVRLPR